MTAIILLLLVVLVGLLITRIATAALMATGMSRQYAKFQSRSAFTGVGFTTDEAENVVTHPIRRRVVMVLMLLGNAGIATVIATLLVGFTGAQLGEQLQRGVVLVAGLAAIWVVASNRRADEILQRFFARILRSRYQLEVQDYAGLLRVGADYAIGELQVQDGDWLADRTLAELRLTDEGVTVLGVERDGSYFGTPGGDTRLEPGDTLTLYGRDDALKSLDERRRTTGGELSHVDQVATQAERVRQEQAAREGGEDPER